jgi:hypothetical protein
VSDINEEDGEEELLSMIDPDLANLMEHKRAEQLSTNCKWLIAKFDELHDILCPDHLGTWQARIEKVMEAVKDIKKDNQ